LQEAVGDSQQLFNFGGLQPSRVYRTEVSREEYWTYTTESVEKAKVKAYKKKYGDIRKAIAVIVQEEQENKAA